MKIAIDVMGGDNSPSINIDGVFQYIENKSLDNIHFIEISRFFILIIIPLYYTPRMVTPFYYIGVI